ncbi:MAG TPA: hypothetical protein VH934_12335 [Xanthobacteraceae bacterium]
MIEVAAAWDDEMEAGDRRITGTVARTRVAPGSKSERVDVVLRTAGGDEYAFRRLGGNAFRDDALEKLVGKTITTTGQLADHIFIMKDWTVESGG